MDAWVIDETWIVRFARTDDVDAALDREVGLLTAIGSALPIPVPRHEVVSGPNEAWPHRFAVHRMLHGVSGEQLRPPPDTWSGLARQLGDFLTALHATPLTVGRQAGLAAESIIANDVLASQTRELIDTRVMARVPETPVRRSSDSWPSSNSPYRRSRRARS